MSFIKFSCYGCDIVFDRTVTWLFGRKNNALIVAVKSLLPKDFLPRKDVERFKQDQFFFIHEDIEIHACFFLLPFVSFLERLECQPVFRLGIAHRAIIVPKVFGSYPFSIAIPAYEIFGDYLVAAIITDRLYLRWPERW